MLFHWQRQQRNGETVVDQNEILQLVDANIHLNKALKLKKFETKCWKFIHGEVDDDGNDDIPLR